jgi:hypothetical protein
MKSRNKTRNIKQKFSRSAERKNQKIKNKGKNPEKIQEFFFNTKKKKLRKPNKKKRKETR